MLLLTTLTTLTTLLPLLTLSSIARADNDWILYRYLDSQCVDDLLPTMADNPNCWVEVGSVSTCIANGGNSWGISKNGGCVMRSWSGGDCRGEATRAYTDSGCKSYPYGSVSVDCPGSTWDGEA